MSSVKSSDGSRLPPAKVLLEMRRHEAKEHRRRLMQGRGRPITSWENGHHRFVAVGDELHWSKNWRTFPDFLFYYIKKVLTLEWGAAEQAKSHGERHPLFIWLEKIRDLRERDAKGKEGEVVSSIMTGAVKAYLGLAYDLYLSAHNAELPARLLKRLRNRDQFEGAVYEAFVIGCFAKAGFSIDFEDEDDSSVSHCEFTATHKETGRKFSVEAKAVTTASKRSGNSKDPPKIRGYLVDALRKQAAHSRIVFIELSRAHSTDESGAPEWIAHVNAQMDQCEKEITIDGGPAPAAYVFVTNRAFVHSLDGATCVELWAAGGFKISDFPPGRNARSMLELHRARQRHIDVHWLLKALETHREIPTSFDDRLPEELAGDMPEVRLRIGDTYLVPNAAGEDVPGVLEDAVVMAPDPKAYGTYRLATGDCILCTTPLTDAEMRAYIRSPETFFGTVKHIPKGIKSALEAFDFVYGTYSRSTREKLLEFMSEWPQIQELRKLGQQELAEHYAAAIAAQMWDDIANGRTKLTQD